MTDHEMISDLRDYLSSIAIARPADDELSRAIEATRAIRPRPAWQAQLATAGGTFRWPASTALRYAVWLVLLLLALALLSVGFAGLGRPPAIPGTGPFEGRWRALDPDGSDLSLLVAPGAAPDVRFEDNYASGCADRGDSNTHWTSRGTGTVDGSQMSVHYPTGGGCSTWHIDAYFDLFVYDSETNTLTDTAGNLWRRPAPN